MNTTKRSFAMLGNVQLIVSQSNNPNSCLPLRLHDITFCTFLLVGNNYYSCLSCIVYCISKYSLFEILLIIPLWKC